ncbi:MAG: 3-isopropylmalate dehydratase large subunit, partial [Candidatus Roizmanbacteria bacterium GW2011_GWA2_37_7]
MKYIHTDRAPKAVGPYSQTIEANGLIFCSGQIGINPETGTLVEGIEFQTNQVLENLKAVLEAAGSSLNKTVKTTVFITNMEDYGAMNKVYSSFFAENKPARMNFGGTFENVVTREEFPLSKAQEVLKNETVAVLGYGVQGPGQSLNMKDNGINVIVGQRKGSQTWEKAVADGWIEGETLFELEEAAKRGTVILYLLSDAGQKAFWPKLKPHLTKGKTLYFSHGFAITFSQETGIVPPADIDVVLVAPKGSGLTVRRNFLDGSGINSSYAVYQDFTKNAQEKTKALGIAVGSGYLFETTFKNEVLSDLTGERGILVGALEGLFEAQYNELRKHGHSPSESFNETVEELTQSLIRLVGENGMDWMLANISTTAKRGALDWKDKFRDATAPVLWSSGKRGKKYGNYGLKIGKNNMPQTLFDKIWDAHIVSQEKNFPEVIFIDAHFIHEVTSPQAFAGLRTRGISVHSPKRTWATADHGVPTKNQHLPIKDLLSAKQVQTLEDNCKNFGIELFGLGHPWQGIVHVIGPELGITKPGMTIVCGDSHTATHGAFGAVAFGIGTSEVEQVLASQTILQHKPKTMKIEINGTVQKGVVAKDIILYIISKLSSSGGTGYFVEYTGDTIQSLSMEARMTICNMSIEMGARGGMIAPDTVTYSYMKGREFMPKGSDWDKAVLYWKTLPSDEGAKYDRIESFDASDIEPMITYGTNPGMGMKINDQIPMINDQKTDSEKKQLKKSLAYMELKEGQKMIGQKVDYVFFGSCTNSRIEDFREAAKILNKRKKAKNIIALLVPGSTQVLKQARKEGLTT